MKVFITGATGFVGKHVMTAVQQSGHDIIALTLKEDKTEDHSNNIHWINGDLADLESLKPALISFNPDVVIHLAWQGIPDYSQAVSKKNLYQSIDFLDFILENTNCHKIIASGSCWEYGRKKGVCRESDPVNIDNYFTWAKHSLNQYLSIKCAEKDVKFNWFRFFYVYGPGQREGALIPTLIKSVGASQSPQVNTPMNKNDFVFVGDIAKAMVKALELDISSGVYNLGSGDATSVYDICHIVEKQLMGKEDISKQVLNNGQNVETVNFWADMEKTQQELNMICDTNLEEGIKEHINYIYPKVSS